ncbi:MAG: hypothetical protein KA178_10110 [Alphaproteobacteria bacterium]|nr:hypothetical protein [Alphaproteobacteria bacterium]MBP7759596.1 hypothetical protein [Alphaproteobacteria bacterium]MBP7763135.1 hypothetical protein [Alphaproteobacteria bacterium]
MDSSGLFFPGRSVRPAAVGLRRIKPVRMTGIGVEYTMTDSPPRGAESQGRSSSGGGGASADGSVAFGKSVRINPRQALPAFSADPVAAYAAVDQQPERTVSCVALICSPDAVPRRKSASVYKSLDDPGLLRLVHSGTVLWPLAGEERHAFVYENSAGEAICKDRRQIFLGWRQERTMEIAFRSLFKIFLEMKRQDFFHGGLSPANLFFRKGSDKSLVLGDGLSAPAGFFQSALCETIERGMVDPAGRGPGTIADDLYAFGATLALVMRETDPDLLSKSRMEVVKRKIEEGSYAVLTGRERLSNPVQELLRGLLHDDPAQRWSADDLQNWADGKRPDPRQPMKRKKAGRALNFAGKNHFFTHTLALDISRDPAGFSKIADDGQLEQWLSRSLDDKETTDRFQMALNNTKNQGRDKSYDELVSTNIRSALMPDWPLEFKGQAFAMDGVDTALAASFVKGEDIRIYHEVFDKGLFLNHLFMKEGQNSAGAKWLKKFDDCRLFVRQMRAGYGLERCLYSLNQNVHCLSPKLKGYFVTNGEEMIRAFEHMAERNKHPELFLDRHSVAFLCELDARCVEGFLYELNSPEKHKLILGNLKTLAQLQRRYKIAQLPNIARALLEIMGPVYERFHDRSIRGNIEGQVKSAARAGDLNGMAAALDNTEVTSKDTANYKKAMMEYYNLSVEAQTITERMKNKESYGLSDAHEFAAMVSATIAIILMILTAVSFAAGQTIL